MDSLLDFLSGPVGPLATGLTLFAIGWIAFGVDTTREERRRKAIETAGKLRGAGFTRLPVFFEDYAVGDLSGMLRSLKELHDVLADPVQRAAELDRVLRLLLTDVFRDPERRPALLKMVDDLKAANLPDARSVIGDAVGDLFTRKSILQELLPGIDTPLRELLSRVIVGNSASPPQSAAA